MTHDYGKSITTLINEYVDGGPGCIRDDCILADDGPSMQTCAYYPPTYNKEGVNVNPDMNITTQTRRCLSCGKTWTESYQNGTRLN